jgi:hypothetical protein
MKRNEKNLYIFLQRIVGGWAGEEGSKYLFHCSLGGYTCKITLLRDSLWEESFYGRGSPIFHFFLCLRWLNNGGCTSGGVQWDTVGALIAFFELGFTRESVIEIAFR